MNLTVNGAGQDLPDGTTVDELVLGVVGRREGTAVAVNDEVVPRSRWAATKLGSGDRVEVLTARQGG